MIFEESATNRGAALYFGTQWSTPLEQNSNFTRIQTEVMNPRFRDGDFAGGFVAGINETYRLLDQHLNPSASDGGVGSILVYIVLVIAGLVIISWAHAFYRRWREERAQNEVAQNEAVAERQRVTEALIEHHEDDEVILYYPLMASN